MSVFFRLVTGWLLLLRAGAAAGGEPSVFLLCNEREPASVELARHYATVRGVPEANLLRLNCAETEAVGREEFERSVRQPVKERLQARVTEARGDRVHPVVLVILRGVPLRVEGTLGTFGQRTREKHRDNDAASVDSELAALALPEPPQSSGSAVNPAFGTDEPSRVIVGRLDGPDWATAKRLVDDAVAAEKAGKLAGRALIDHAQMAGHGPEYARGDGWLNALEKRFHEKGFAVTANHEAGLIASGEGAAGSVLFYAGWYSPHVSGLLKRDNFRFQRGAVACHIHSLSAQTVRASSQRWAGPLLARGAAVVLGNVDEPFLSHHTHLDVFFERLLAGDSTGEAMWKSTPRLSWMNVMIGDPLYRPFRGRSER